MKLRLAYRLRFFKGWEVLAFCTNDHPQLPAPMRIKLCLHPSATIGQAGCPKIQAAHGLMMGIERSRKCGVLRVASVA
jgi:hypothetical protein